MPSIPLDEVFLRLVIQAMISSAQVPSRTKDAQHGGPGCTTGQAAQQGGPVGCRLRRVGMLHTKLGCGKRWTGGLPFSAARSTALLCSPLARPSVFCAARRKFTFFIWKHGPSARPAGMSIGLDLCYRQVLPETNNCCTED